MPSYELSGLTRPVNSAIPCLNARTLQRDGLAQFCPCGPALLFAAASEDYDHRGDSLPQSLGCRIEATLLSLECVDQRDVKVHVICRNNSCAKRIDQ